jgi:uncharacterized OB-fold protein
VDIDAFERLLPAVTPANRPYWDGLAAGELRVQFCDDDGMAWFPESPVCPRCLSPKFTWQATSGRGTLWSWICMHQNYFAAFEDERPFVIAFIRLEEGPFVIGTVTDPAERLTIDAGVEVDFDRVGRHAVAKFRLAK